MTVNVARSHRARRVSAAQLARGPTSFVASGGVVTETRGDDDGATVRATRAARGGSAGANDIARARPRARERARERGRNARDSAARAGTTLMVLEAMKMEHRIVAASDGVVTAVHFNADDQVEQGVELLSLEDS